LPARRLLEPAQDSGRMAGLDQAMTKFVSSRLGAAEGLWKKCVSGGKEYPNQSLPKLGATDIPSLSRDTRRNPDRFRITPASRAPTTTAAVAPGCAAEK